MSGHPFDRLTVEQLRRHKNAKWTHYPPTVIPAWVAEMDFPLAEPIKRAVLAATEIDDYGYPPFLEDVDFREMFAGWADRSYGWKVDPESVLVVADVVRAMKFAVDALTEPGDGILIQPPVYPPFFTVVKDTGRTVVENPLVIRNGRFEVDLEGFERALASSKLFFLCNPQNPTGRVFSRKELEAMAELAVSHGVIVVSDEIHSPLVLPGASHTAFATLGDEVAAHTVTVTSAAKAWNFGGLKCALAVGGSPELTERIMALGKVNLGGPDLLGMLATEAAYTEGAPWMAEVVGYLDGNRRLLGELLADRLSRVVYIAPESTYLAWLDCRALDLPAGPFEFFLNEAKVALSPGPNFGTQGEGWVRLNFATSRGILTEIVERMAKAATPA